MYIIHIANLRKIADLYGESYGDTVADLYVQNVKHFVGSSALEEMQILTFARFTPDTFAVALRGKNNSHVLQHVTDILTEAAKKPVTVNNLEISLAFSIGAASGDSIDADSLIKNASIAQTYSQYMQQQACEFYRNEMSRVGLEKFHLETDLRNALKNNEFELYYQPKFSINANRIKGLEVLLRWHHPARGLVMPDEYIMLAEETGAILEIGAWVIEEACKQCKIWQKAGYPDLQVAVNLSARQFSDINLVRHVRTSLEKSGLAAHYLELELTESILMENDEKTVNCLHELKTLGVTLAIDDFGTGYSSLRYLAEYPLDKIKIDKCFIRSLPESKRDATITKTIIGLAKELNLLIVAEGVETKEQFNFLAAHGCDEIQGFYVAKPMTVTNIDLAIH